MKKKRIVTLTIVFAILSVVLLFLFQIFRDKLAIFIDKSNFNSQVHTIFSSGKKFFLDGYEIKTVSVAGLYLQNFRFVPVTLNGEQLIRAELAFIANVSGQYKTVSISTIMPFQEVNNKLLFPEESDKYFEKGKYYSLTFANHVSPLDQGQIMDYCQQLNEEQVDSYAYCVVRQTNLLVDGVDKITSFFSGSNNRLSLENVWLLRIDELFINIE